MFWKSQDRGGAGGSSKRRKRRARQKALGVGNGWRNLLRADGRAAGKSGTAYRGQGKRKLGAGLGTGEDNMAANWQTPSLFLGSPYFDGRAERLRENPQALDAQFVRARELVLPKGELAAHTAVHRAASPGHKVVVLDPFGVVEANYPRLYARHPGLFKSHGFNPVAALDPASPRFVDDAKELAVALIKTDDSRDKYWSQAAQALVKGLIMGLRLAFGEKASLARLRLLLGEPPAKLAETNAKLIQAFGQKCPAIAASLGEFATYSPNDDKELGAVRRTAKVQTD